MTIRQALACALLAGWGGLLQIAAADDVAIQRAGPLSGLPGKTDSQLEKIRALADDTWLNLGPPAPDPRWGVARGRSWTPKMAFAPDLRAAFLYGEGVHAYVKPDGHFMDDLWSYDLNAHRWICVYPGADAKKLDVKLDKNGFTVAPDEHPLPVAQMAHGYEGMSYDTDARKFVFVPCESPYSRAKLGALLPLLSPDRDRKRIRVCPWFYDTTTGRWERRSTTGPYPKGTNMESVVQYVPSKKQVFFMHVREAWFYDPAKNTWTNAAPKGPLPPFGIDSVACYDSKRDRIYVGGGSYPVANALWIYDVQANTWIDPKPEGQPGKGNANYAGGYATMQYDAAGDVVVMTLYRAEKHPERRGTYIYDPATNRWTTEPRPLPEAITERKNLNAFYDPRNNVHYFHAAGDSDTDGTMWVYRYRTVKK